MKLLLPICTCSMSGFMGVAMGFFNMGVQGGERFFAWDFILGGMCIGLATGIILHVLITPKSKAEDA